MLSVSSPLLRRPQRSIRRRHRSEGNECGSPSFSPRHLLFVGIFLVSACFSTPCSSFQIALQSQRHQHWRQKKNRPAFNDKNAKVQETRTPPSSILRSTGKNDESFSLSSAHKHIVSGESLSQSSDANTNLSFDDVAESPAPPLNYKKYLTMQKKRVPVTIRYSADSGLKPYYLTVAKRVKDLYPDVLIERIKIDDGGTEDGGGDPKYRETGTFEVAVDGKLVVRTQRSSHKSIYVSMSEMDAAILRARKRRRPSTVYGENGIAATPVKDQLVKARLEALKQKARELQRTNREDQSEEKAVSE